jgi:hypothetical protein
MMSLGTGIYALIQEPTNGWLWGGSGLALVVFLCETWYRGEKALFDVRILRNLLFVQGGLNLFVFSGVLMAAFVVYGVFLRQEHSVFTAAILLFPLPATAVGVSWLLSWFLKGQQKPSFLILYECLGLVLMALGLGGFALFSSFSPVYPWILVVDLMVGAGMGIGMSVLNAVALLQVAPARLGEASGLLGLMQQLGYTVGTAVLIWLLEIQGGTTLLASYHLVWWEAAACMLAALLIVGSFWWKLEKLPQTIEAEIAPVAPSLLPSEQIALDDERKAGM